MSTRPAHDRVGTGTGRPRGRPLDDAGGDEVAGADRAAHRGHDLTCAQPIDEGTTCRPRRVERPQRVVGDLGRGLDGPVGGSRRRPCIGGDVPPDGQRRHGPRGRLEGLEEQEGPGDVAQQVAYGPAVQDARHGVRRPGQQRPTTAAAPTERRGLRPRRRGRPPCPAPSASAGRRAEQCGQRRAQAARSTSTPTLNWPSTARASPPTTPSRVTGTPRDSAIATRADSSDGDTTTTARAVDSENSATNGSPRPRRAPRCLP